MSACIILYKPNDNANKVINLTYLNSVFEHKNKLKSLQNINWQIVEGEKVTPVEECLYMQGWFFKKSLLNRKEPFYFTRSKDNMIKFLYKYIKGKKADIIHALEDAWEDGMIFEFAY